MVRRGKSVSVILYGQNYLIYFLMGIVYLWYILSAKANCVSCIDKLECTMFVMWNVLCHITCKSWCDFDSLLYWVYIAVLRAHDCIVCSLLYCVYYACIGCTFYLRFILCICSLYYCLCLTPDYSLLGCRTTG